MTVSVLSAAKRLAQHSEWTLSNLELQKILYLAHMFYLGRTGQPLVNGHFGAWDFGPVHPTLYHRAKVYGSDPVRNIFHDVPDIPDGPERDILDEACDALSNAGPGKLVNATHRKNGAWANNYVPGVRGIVIPNTDILAEFQNMDDGDEAA